MRVRPARAGERATVLSVLDAAMLETDADRVADRITDDAALVAVVDGRVLGALVATPGTDGATVEAVAVRPRRRGGGVGTALVEAAGDRWGRLVADFDPGVRSFYESLGFRVTRTGERCRGVRD